MSGTSKSSLGFTLAELLVALAILGAIATFTIPKIITAQTNERNNAVAREVLGTLAGAFQRLQADTGGDIPDSTTVGALTQYMNYVSVTTSDSSVDAYPNPWITTIPCSAVNQCVKFANGAVMMLDNGPMSGGYIGVVLDIDGVLTTHQDSIIFLVLANGRVVDMGSYLGDSSYTPAWFRY